MTTHRYVGLYYWRGRPLRLFVAPDYSYRVEVPRHLHTQWRQDVTTGKVKL